MEGLVQVPRAWLLGLAMAGLYLLATTSLLLLLWLATDWTYCRGEDCQKEALLLFSDPLEEDPAALFNPKQALTPFSNMLEAEGSLFEAQEETTLPFPSPFEAPPPSSSPLADILHSVQHLDFNLINCSRLHLLAARGTCPSSRLGAGQSELVNSPACTLDPVSRWGAKQVGDVTPLWLAAAHGHTHTARLLLDAGAEVNNMGVILTNTITETVTG